MQCVVVRMTTAALAVGLVVGLAGRGATPTVSRSDVEAKSADVVQQQVGTRPTVRCPADLRGKVGATLTCTVTLHGSTQPLTVTVTAVSGKTVNFEVSVKPS